jgi:sugar/nucleoside kinase (ribokinase family)
VTDTNGAGDAFAGGFLFGLCRGYGLRDAAALGNRCAAAIITHAGARPIHDYKRLLPE